MFSKMYKICFRVKVRNSGKYSNYNQMKLVPQFLLWYISNVVLLFSGTVFAREVCLLAKEVLH